MNSEAIKQQLAGTGPFVIRTVDGKEFTTTNADLVGCTASYLVIENALGAVEILPKESVAAIAQPTGSKASRGHAAFLNGYAPEDEGLYDDVLRG